MGLYDLPPLPAPQNLIVTLVAAPVYQSVEEAGISDGDPVLHCNHLNSTSWQAQQISGGIRYLKNGYVVSALFNAACKACADALALEAASPPSLTHFSSWDSSAGKPAASGALPLR